MTIDHRLTERTRSRYQRNARWYDWMEAFPERRFNPWRNQLWGMVTGEKILEIGVGTGKNMPFYPQGLSVTAIDLTPAMLERAVRRAAKLDLAIELKLGDAQCLDFADASFDSVVATFVFCSVPDPVLGLREAKRVTKPGGKLYLLEHMRSTNPFIGQLMDTFNPFVVRMMGANINRKTAENVKLAGFTIEQMVEWDRQGIFKLIVATT